MKSALLEDAANWRELAMSGADLTWADLDEWQDVLRRVDDMLDGAVAACQMLPVGSSAAGRVSETLDPIVGQHIADSRAWRERQRRMTAELNQLLDTFAVETDEGRRADIRKQLAAYRERHVRVA